MSIDINNLGSTRPDGARRQDSNRDVADVAKPAPGAESAAAAKPARGENVSLSAAAKQLAQIENQLKDLPEVDEARVAEIKARVDSGDYKIDSGNMAQKMLGMDG